MPSPELTAHPADSMHVNAETGLLREAPKSLLKQSFGNRKLDTGTTVTVTEKRQQDQLQDTGRQALCP